MGQQGVQHVHAQGTRALHEMAPNASSGQPSLLLLDEPTEGIQPSIVEEIGEALAALRDYMQFTIVLIEQNLEVISTVSQRVLVSKRGQRGEEIPHEHLAKPAIRSEYTGAHGRGRPRTVLRIACGCQSGRALRDCGQRFLAEEHGSRTHRARWARPTGFEDRGFHRKPGPSNVHGTVARSHCDRCRLMHAAMCRMHQACKWCRLPSNRVMPARSRNSITCTVRLRPMPVRLR